MIQRKHTKNMKGESLSTLIESVCSKGKPALVKARGTSMLPAIRPGDILVIKNLGARKPGLGDIVSFLDSNGEYVVHRVIWKKNRLCLIKGDNVIGGIEHIACSDILGLVREITRISPVDRTRKLISESRAMRYLLTVLSILNMIRPMMRLLSPNNTHGNRCL